MLIRRCLIISAALALPLLACAKGAPPANVTAEAPPPPMEPELGPGSGLVEPRADQLVRQMSDRLARITDLTMVAEETYDEVPADAPRQQLTCVRSVAMHRPDRLVGTASGDARNGSFWYDGQTFTAIDHEQNVWASGTVPPTIDGALDWVFGQTGTAIPLGDFLFSNAYDRLMSDVQRGVYLGVHEVNGVPCHHLSFEQATIDWQIWIDAGSDPLPRKLVITYKTEDEVPQYSVTIRKWNIQAKVPESLFHFTPPEGAKRIDVPTLAQAYGDEGRNR